MRGILVIAVLLLVISCQSAREGDSTRLEKDGAANAELNRINALLTSNRPITKIDVDAVLRLRSEYPASPVVRRVLQGALIKRGDWASAETVINEIPERERTNVDRINLAKVFFKQGKFSDTVVVLKSMSAGADERVEVAALLGQSQFYTGEFNEAAKTLESIRNDLVVQKRADDLAHLGMAYYRLGENQKALEVLQQAVEISPQNTTAHSALVRVHTALGDAAQAEGFSVKLRAINERIAAGEKKKSRLVPLYYRLEDAYAAKDFDKVVSLVAQIQPDADDQTRGALYQYLAAAYRAQGKEKEAQKAIDDGARLTQK